MKSPGAEAPGQHIPYFLLCNCNCPLFQPDPDNGQRADCHCRQITKDRTILSDFNATTFCA